MFNKTNKTKNIFNIFLITMITFIAYIGFLTIDTILLQRELLQDIPSKKFKRKVEKPKDIIYTIINNTKGYTIQQKKIILRSYEVGKPYGLGYTLAAIAISESTSGKYQINFKDPSCGIYHNLLTSVFARLGYKDTNLNRSMICTRLILDPKFAEQQAIDELLFWKAKYEGEPLAWQHMVESYNAGHKHEKGHTYFLKIKKYVEFFQGK